MQEQDVTDWKERLAAYTPETEQERRDRNEILLAAEQYGTQLLYRSHAESHFTCSGFVMNPAMDQVLMVYHRIYDSFAWTGGHADGSSDFLFLYYKPVHTLCKWSCLHSSWNFWCIYSN